MAPIMSACRRIADLTQTFRDFRLVPGGDIARKIRDCPGGGVGMAVQRPIALTTQNCACNRPEKIETGPRSALYPGLLTN